MQIGSCSSLIHIFLLRCLTVVSRKLLIEDISRVQLEVGPQFLRGHLIYEKV